MKTPQVSSATPWPEADRLFHQDPRWLGSDDAYSIALPNAKTLWLFGDTFVAAKAGLTRSECAFVRNSIGLQEGLNPTSAKISFYWGEDGGYPSDFFPVEEGWLWPLHGVLIDGSVLLFFMKVRSPRAARPSEGIDEWMQSDSLSFFEVYGWTAFLVREPGNDPMSWKLEELAAPENDLGVIIGAGVLAEGGWLYSWGWTQERNGYLVRWKHDDASRGDLAGIQWWGGPGDWSSQPKERSVALNNAQTEFVVYRHSSGLLFQLQAIGLNSADLTMRWAEGPEGPWTEPQPFYRLPESEREGVIAYAGKAHPQLEGADLVCTYASNGDSAEVTINDESIYYPRFVKAQLSVPRKRDTPDPLEAQDPRPEADHRSAKRSARSRANASKGRRSALRGLAQVEEAVSIHSGTGSFTVRERGGRVAELFSSPDLPNVFFEGNIKGVEGGDRVWISPELDLFYDDPNRLETWRCPPELDPGSWSMEEMATGIRLRQTALGTEMIRTIAPLDGFPTAEEEGVSWSGYRISNTLISDRPWSAWQLLMLPSPADIFVRDASGPIVYYSPVPEVSDGWVHADGRPPRWKVGFDAPPDSNCVIGVLSEEDPGSLVMVIAELPPAGIYVDRPPVGNRAAAIQIFDSMGEGFCEVELHAPLETRVVESTVVAVWGEKDMRVRLLEKISSKGSRV